MEIQFKKPDYIVLYVSDMQRSTEFYRDVLGFSLRFASPGWTEFSTGDVTLALHIGGAPRNEATEKRPPAGSAQFAFVVDDIQATYEALKAKDVHFSMSPEKQSTGRTLATLRDPDGFGITLQER